MRGGREGRGGGAVEKSRAGRTEGVRFFSFPLLRAHVGVRYLRINAVEIKS